jgi:hypothetical protein
MEISISFRKNILDINATMEMGNLIAVVALQKKQE